MKRVVAAVYRHWFEPASLRDLAMVRIVVVSAQLLFFMPGLADTVRFGTIEGSSYSPLPFLKLLLLPFAEWGARPEPMFMQLVWLVAVVAGVLAVIGCFTRPSLLLFAATNTLMELHGYSFGELHHPPAPMMLALWVLALGPSGEALSVDDLRRRLYAAGRFMAFRPRSRDEELSEFARWPLRTIQWVVVLAYLSAGLSKLANSGLDWVNGYTLGYFLLQNGLRWDKPLGVYLHDKNALLIAFSVVALVFELAFAVAVLVPYLTPFFLVAGVGFHIGLFVLLDAAFFQWPLLYVAFVDEIRRALTARLRPRPPPAWTVIYDGACRVCIETMVLVEHADVRRRLRFVDLERAASEPGITPDAGRHLMYVVAPGGQVFRGFFAFRRLARVSPALWPLVPLLYMPLAARIGPAFYARIWASRCNSGRCDDTGSMRAAEPQSHVANLVHAGAPSTTSMPTPGQPAFVPANEAAEEGRISGPPVER